MATICGHQNASRFSRALSRAQFFRRQEPLLRLRPVGPGVLAGIGVVGAVTPKLGHAHHDGQTGLARLALSGRSAMEANQSLTCSTAMASTVRWPKAGRIYLRTT